MTWVARRTAAHCARTSAADENPATASPTVMIRARHAAMAFKTARSASRDGQDGEMIGARRRLRSAVAGQLGRPHGFFGPVVAIMLNRGKGRAIAAAVDSAEVPTGGVVADVGFGGGIGLSLLLDRVGDGGVVAGIE